MESGEEILRKFHKIDLHIASAVGWLSSVTITGFLATRIITGNGRWTMACIPVGFTWLVSGLYEMKLRKQLGDPTIES